MAPGSSANQAAQLAGGSMQFEQSASVMPIDLERMRKLGINYQFRR